jgi:ABC-2 type transport system ATP-binding protein
MRQKLLLALALATDASLLVLDEPTASLDVQSRRRFFELVAELPQRPSIILCSHRLEEINNLVDRVVVLEDGRVVRDAEARSWANQITNGRRAEMLSEMLTQEAYR